MASRNGVKYTKWQCFNCASINDLAEPVMHGNIATAWEDIDSDECPQCKAIRQAWHEIMDDTENIKMRSDGAEVSETTGKQKPKYKKQ